jgi:hypothetical protein
MKKRAKEAGAKRIYNQSRIWNRLVIVMSNKP